MRKNTSRVYDRKKLVRQDSIITLLAETISRFVQFIQHKETSNQWVWVTRRAQPMHFCDQDKDERRKEFLDMFKEQIRSSHRERNLPYTTFN